jgi:hypothetical protein
MERRNIAQDEEKLDSCEMEQNQSLGSGKKSWSGRHSKGENNKALLSTKREREGQ